MTNLGLLYIQILFCLGFSTATLAQLPQEQGETRATEVKPQEQNQLAVSYEDEIEKDELPEEATASLNETYPGFKITEIYRGSDGSFKVRLKKDNETIAAFLRCPR
jgi:hypothetical protein